MRSYLLVLGTICGITAANPYPWMYGVPDFPDLSMEEVMTQADIDVLMSDAADNGSTSQTTAQAPGSSTATVSAGQEPCAVVSRALAAMPSEARKVIPAELGVQCLQSVPLDREGNAKLIDDLKLFAKWQSNIAYLKSPPQGYTERPVDIFGALDDMASRLSAGNFKNEYDFQMELMNLIGSGYDNHFAWQPDILAGAMQFQRSPGTELVSISADGRALPEVFTYQDILKANNDSSYQPSPVMAIDGIAVKDYLTNASAQSDFHDADTRWNSLFPSQPLIAAGTTFLGSFRTGQYQGPNTTIQFANGTTRSMPNLAVVFGNFTGVDSGLAFFQRFCSGPQPLAAPPPAPMPPGNATEPTVPPAPSHIGYPKAELINENLAIGGYYLSDSGYEDVAVLSIPSYDSADVQSFQNTMRDFIRASQAAGKTKMIFDMRGNGGGNAILGYDTFKQVFPQASQEPFGGTQFRANEALDRAGKITQDFLERKTHAQRNKTAFAEAFGPGTTEVDVFQFTAGFNYQHQLNVENEAFESWDELFGPVQANGDRFTTTLRYNFSDGISTTYNGFSVIGFGENANESQTPQPFQAQDMVMLHDGMCSSTCAIASELLKNQGGVRTIAIGGRPEPGPMQGIGGTKGAQVFSWNDIQIRMQAVFFLGSPEQQAQWEQEDLGKTAFATQLFQRSAYRNGRVAGGVNLKDNLRQNDASRTPLEFIYEAADCRMWFTARMVTDVTEVWKGVADRMFKNGTSLCVEGSTGDASSVSGGGQTRGGDGVVAPVLSPASEVSNPSSTRGKQPQQVTSGADSKGRVGGWKMVGEQQWKDQVNVFFLLYGEERIVPPIMRPPTIASPYEEGVMSPEVKTPSALEPSKINPRSHESAN
ncbi:hypothetical protein LEMA_P096650.1 [Plenodomus lingam JN3]|uniref:CPAF-like PDZ domain-containing protein n=1 Tax=Leptosphaeria maculans (strain JN3 / isolate v23.1.3 / race Av1-4-5-6-7-8) TaxID=985895 RepID=E5A3P3_LEPMJ|nr:hypothetical protein LEMA_P096650.1 [Plenodomus lingam JN3]CBX98256.1 hypothetical protein LEMA_P096650.1 [Plenodomus lingam JN3]